MDKTVKLIIAAVLIFSGMFGEHIAGWVKNIKLPDVVDIIPDPEPSQKFKDMVQSIVSIDISPKDAAILTPFFNELASVVESDPGVIKTTGQFRDFNIMAGALNFTGTDLKGKYPTLGESIDNAIVAAIGKQSVSIGDKRSDLVLVLRAISWSINK